MAQALKFVRKLPGRNLPVRRVAWVVLVGALGIVGLQFLAGHKAQPAKPANREPDKKAVDLSAVFRGLRPCAGDCMTPPRIGFRWTFDASRLPAPGEPAAASGGVASGSTTSSTGPAQDRDVAARSLRDAGSAGVSKASIMPGFLTGADSIRVPGFGRHDVRYRIHVLGAGGKTEIVTETDQPRVTLNLTAGFPIGECQWWVEALLPGRDPVCSPREKFTLQR